MEKLVIRNFLNLKDIEFEINRINIIIGKQAEGKSNLSKLVYYFKDIIKDYESSILFVKTIPEFKKECEKKFLDIFPKYLLSGSKFLICYVNNDIEISISKEKESKNIKLNLPKSLTKKHSYLRRKYNVTDYEIKDIVLKNFFKINQYIEKNFFTIDNQTYIPAGRSFFANLQQRIFNFLKNDISIDYFLKEFGSIYEKEKAKFKDISNKDVISIINGILRGKYLHYQDKDWIKIHNDKLIFLEDSSSGQQEVLPMLIVISTLATLEKDSFYPNLFIIEEPETHLYPFTQKLIIDLFGLLYNVNEEKNKFFIATHSPYILTSIDNLIQADNTYNTLISKNKDNSEKLIKELNKIIPRKKHIKFKDVSAYYLEKGLLKSIKDFDNKQIDSNAIDDVSNQINKESGQLLELEFGDEN